MMQGEYEVTRFGREYYAITRMKDITKVWHSGNIEILKQGFNSEEEAKMYLDEFQKKSIDYKSLASGEKDND